MPRLLFLLMIACSVIICGDVATYAAHIGGATRPEHVAMLTPMVGDLPAATRRLLITRLTAMEMPDGIPLLEKLLPFADEIEMDKIFQVYQNIRHERAVPAMIAACQDSRAAVRAQAWATMTQVPFIEDQRGNAILRTFLRERLADPQYPERMSAATALYQVGTADEIRAAEEIILSDERTTPSLLNYRRQILSRRGDPRVFALVLDDLRQDYDKIGKNAQVDAAMDIGTALRAGAPLDEETRRLLLHTIRVCPHDEPASFAAEALRDIRDQTSYPTLLEILGHSQADEAIVEALCAIDPVRALADWRQLLRTADELRLESAILYGPAHTALHPAFSDFIAQSPMDLDEATRSRRRDALSQLFWSSWPSTKSDADPALHRAFLAAHRQDGDPEVARLAVRNWSRLTFSDLTTDFTPDLITQVRAWANQGSKEERQDAIWILTRRPAKFIPELATLVRTTTENPMIHWLLQACCKHGGIIPADELADLVFSHYQRDHDQVTIVNWYAALFATGPGEERAFELLFVHQGRSREQRALMTRGAINGIRPLRLQSFVRRWDQLDDGQRDALVAQLGVCPKDTTRFAHLAERVSAYANHRDSERLVAGIMALSQHDLEVAPTHLAYDLVKRGLAHLATLSMNGLPYYVSSWEQLRRALLTLAKTHKSSFILDDDIEQALVHSDSRRRGMACVVVQMGGASNKLDDSFRARFLQLLFVTAASESVALRSEAALALRCMVRPEDFSQLSALFLSDPASRVPLAAALRVSDPQRAEEFLLAERARLHLDDLNLWLKALATDVSPLDVEP